MAESKGETIRRRSTHRQRSSKKVGGEPESLLL